MSQRPRMRGMWTRTGIPALYCSIALIAIGLLPRQADSQITRAEIEVVESPALGGRSFGTIGMYERLRGEFYGEVDPSDVRHANIVNIDRAPLNSRGRIEYRTTVEIYRPMDMSRWNGAIYHTVPNRGGPGAGPDVLLEMGFALVRVGWQGDIKPTDTNIAAQLPIAVQSDGSSIVGTALEEFISGDSEGRSTDTLTYPAASLDPARATLTVRENQEDPRQTPEDMTWRYLDERTIVIERPSGFDGGAIYEFIYKARDPIVMGLGFAAMRDAISFLRYGWVDKAGNANPLAPGRLAEVVLSIGTSQGGRYLRDMLYLGFNEDVEGRIVFDGIHPDIAGSRKTFTNYTFGQPGRWQKQHEDHVYPGDQFPFSYVATFDPISGRTEGLQDRCSASKTCPRIIHSDGEAELWQGRASLVVTDARGGDIQLPDNVRVYLYSGTQHGGRAGVHVYNPTYGICQNLSNPMALSQIRTALTVALYEWVAHGTPPPPSRYPKVSNGGLVPPSATGFPDIPGLTYSASYNPLRLHDPTDIPPHDGEAYPVFVGRVDTDGNMIDGIRHPFLAVPIGTHTGWNLRREGFAEGEQCAGAGTFLPFASTKEEREAKGDPRLSLEERYPTHQSYVEAVARSAAQLVAERFLLPEDANDIVRVAAESEIGGSQQRHPREPMARDVDEPGLLQERSPLQITDWVHVTRPAAATGAGTRTGSLGKAPDTPPPICRSAEEMRGQ